jgi:26S proteasome regulatory subunit N9
LISQEADLQWLFELLNAFNSGKIDLWNELSKRYAAQIAQHPAVSQSIEMLSQKVAILALIELIWSCPADGRTLSFQAIASATKLPLERVEWLIMRSLSLKLVQGEIDQVQSVFIVASVAARILSFDQIASMQQRVKLWAEHVQHTLVQVESESHGIIV